MSLFAGFAATIALLAASAPPEGAAPDIVIKGQRLDEAYRACVAGGCSVLRDAQVSIAMAERQFRDGGYRAAKRTMAAAVDRNRDNAASNPRPVAALYEAYATVALNDGDLDVYRRAVAGRVRTLRDHLPEGDPAKRDAPLAVGDMWVKLGNPRDAAAIYTVAERDAQRAGDVRGALIARMRRVGLAVAMEDMVQARRLLREAAEGPAGSDPVLRPVLRVMELRYAARTADDAELDRLVGEIGQASASAPTLIWEPPYTPSAGESARNQAIRFGGVDPSQPSSSEVSPIQWADIGFWIGTDGRTREAEVLRGTSARGWTGPVLQQISGRRYTGVAEASGEGVYRVERFTSRGSYVVPKGSLIARRAGPRQIEVVDLTRPSASPTARPPSR